MNLLAVLWISGAVWMLFTWTQNRRALTPTGKADPFRKTWPRVSVLIPARNEEKRIGPLLDGLVRQDYPSFEVWVLDDESEDGTRGIVSRFSRKDRRFRLLKGKPLPAGWRGKPWACHQLSRRAKGEWLLFVDADTWHSPDMLKRSIQEAERRKADILSLLTRQVTPTWLEALVVPVMIYNFFVAIPSAWVFQKGSWASRWAGVSGQFILVRKKAYRSFGGHEAVKNEIVEDLRLGKAAVRVGCRVIFADGSDLATARMYTDASEVWEGFTKNFFPAVDFSIPKFLLLQTVFLLNGVAPFLVVVAYGMGALPMSPWVAAALTYIGAQWFIRAAHARDYGFTGWSVPFHPLGVLLFSLIGFNSMRVYVLGSGGRWKNRRLEGG